MCITTEPRHVRARLYTGIGNTEELLHLKLIRKLLLLDDERRSLDRLHARRDGRGQLWNETCFFFFLQNVLQPLRTMARFDINTRVSRVFLRGYAALLRSPHSSSHSHFFLFRSSVFFTLEKTQPVARIARFQSDDGKVNGYDFDSSWRLSFPIIRITGWCCLISLVCWTCTTIPFPFFCRFVSLKLISAAINHNDETRKSRRRINEISRHRTLFVFVSSLSLSLFSIFFLFRLNFRIESIYRPNATDSVLLSFPFLCLNNSTIFNLREEKK